MHLALKKHPRDSCAGFIAHSVGKFLDKSEHSHGELIFSSGISASSVIGSGVVLRRLEYTPEAWDFYTLPESLEPGARDWFLEHLFQPYDNYYMLRFGIPLFSEKPGSWGCLEAIGAALGWSESWRYGPGGALARCKDMYKSRQVSYSEVFSYA